MITIDSDYLIACLLWKQEKVTWKDLNELKTRIYNLFPGIRLYIDVSRNNVMSAVSCNPDMLRWDTNSCGHETDDIIRGFGFGRYTMNFIHRYIGSDVPDEIKNKVREILFEEV